MRRILSFHAGRGLAIGIAALVLLGAVAGSATLAPPASAQCFYYSCGYGGYGGYGLGLGGYYGGFGYNSLYNSCNLGGYYGGFGYCNNYYNPYYSGYNGYTGYVYPFASSAYSNYSSPVYYQNATTYTAPSYVATRQLATSGQYCTDKSGGMIWVPAGSPPDPSLTCGGTVATATTTTTGSTGTVVTTGYP